MPPKCNLSKALNIYKYLLLTFCESNTPPPYTLFPYDSHVHILRRRMTCMTS